LVDRDNYTRAKRLNQAIMRKITTSGPNVYMARCVGRGLTSDTCIMALTHQRVWEKAQRRSEQALLGARKETEIPEEEVGAILWIVVQWIRWCNTALPTFVPCCTNGALRRHQRLNLSPSVPALPFQSPPVLLPIARLVIHSFAVISSLSSSPAPLSLLFASITSLPSKTFSTTSSSGRAK
jgi:hypothetical protein